MIGWKLQAPEGSRRVVNKYWLVHRNVNHYSARIHWLSAFFHSRGNFKFRSPRSCVFSIAPRLLKMVSHYELLSRIHFRQSPKEKHRFCKWLMKQALLRKSMNCPSCCHLMKLRKPYGTRESAWWVCLYFLLVYRGKLLSFIFMHYIRVICLNWSKWCRLLMDLIYHRQVWTYSP